MYTAQLFTSVWVLLTGMLLFTTLSRANNYEDLDGPYDEADFEYTLPAGLSPVAPPTPDLPADLMLRIETDDELPDNRTVVDLPTFLSLLTPNVGNLTKRHGPAWPAGGRMPLVTDEHGMNPDPAKWPMGIAFEKDRPCETKMWLKSTWMSHRDQRTLAKWRRRRLLFEKPPGSHTDQFIFEAVTSAFWYYYVDNWSGFRKGVPECGGKPDVKRFWVFIDKSNMITLDFSMDPSAVGDMSAGCRMKHFYEQWSRWTGCEYQWIRTSGGIPI